MPTAAPPPDSSQPLVLALLASNAAAGTSPLDEAGQQRVLEAVQRQLSLSLEPPFVPLSEVARARDLHEQGRLRAGGPVCGLAPSVETILWADHRRVAVGRVELFCASGHIESDRCALRVTFAVPGDPSRDEGVPRPFHSQPVGNPTTVDAWLRAAERLRIASTEHSLGALRLDSPPSVPYRAELVTTDPVLRGATPLWEPGVREAVADCVARNSHEGFGPAAIVRARLRLASDGSVESVEALPSQRPVEWPEGLLACVAGVMERTRWPCPVSEGGAVVEAVICADEGS